MNTLQCEITEISAPVPSDLLDEICQFRVQVWREEGSLSANAFENDRWCDSIDHSSQHWIIRDMEQQLAAAGRLSLHATLAEVHESHEYTQHGLDLDGPVAAPDRVVVAGHARGCGFGKQILDIQDAAAVAQGAQHAVRQASPRMTKLLAHRGWKLLGPASIDARFPHTQFSVMVKHF